MFLLNKWVFESPDSESFKKIDLATQTLIPTGSTHPGAFGVQRRHHYHEGVDIYGQQSDPVFAPLDGVFLGYAPFTGSIAQTPWWLDTYAALIYVENLAVTVFLGEIEPLEEALAPKIGEPIEEGMVLGHIARVLKNDKGRPMDMVHVEMYAGRVVNSCGIWNLQRPKPDGLIDPTPYLLMWAKESGKWSGEIDQIESN